MFKSVKSANHVISHLLHGFQLFITHLKHVYYMYSTFHQVLDRQQHCPRCILFIISMGGGGSHIFFNWKYDIYSLLYTEQGRDDAFIYLYLQCNFSFLALLLHIYYTSITCRIFYQTLYSKDHCPRYVFMKIYLVNGKSCLHSEFGRCYTCFSTRKGDN